MGSPENLNPYTFLGAKMLPKIPDTWDELEELSRTSLKLSGEFVFIFAVKLLCDKHRDSGACHIDCPLFASEYCFQTGNDVV